jgi:hypothetical protein
MKDTNKSALIVQSRTPEENKKAIKAIKRKTDYSIATVYALLIITVAVMMI